MAVMSGAGLVVENALSLVVAAVSVGPGVVDTLLVAAAASWAQARSRATMVSFIPIPDERLESFLGNDEGRGQLQTDSTASGCKLCVARW